LVISAFRTLFSRLFQRSSCLSRFPQQRFHGICLETIVASFIKQTEGDFERWNQSLQFRF